MNKIKSQKGQAIILIAFAVVGLVGFAALAIDGGRVLSDRRHAQNAADTSAFAAALAKIQGQNYVTAAQTRAASNGYNNGVNATVEVNLCNATGVTCQGLPGGANPAEYIQVKIKSIIPATFARVIGRRELESNVEAVARASSVTSNPFVQGAALAAYKQDGIGIFGHGGGDLTIIGSGMFSNSDQTGCPNGSMKLTGSINYHVDTGYVSAGDVCSGNNTDLGTNPNIQEQIAQVPTPSYNIPAPSFVCGGVPNPMKIGNEYQPGTYNDLTINSSGDWSFAPGSYCFNGAVKFTKGNITANGVNFRLNSGSSLSVTGANVNFSCSDMIIHSAGGSGISFRGGATDCNGITFFLETGDVDLNGNSSNIFKAPTSGDYKGLLIYLPEGNTNSIAINGTSGSQYTGSIIGISSAVSITGSSDSAGYNVQVIANTIDLGGTSNITIEYDPAVIFNPPQYPTIELIK